MKIVIVYDMHAKRAAEILQKIISQRTGFICIAESFSSFSKNSEKTVISNPVMYLGDKPSETIHFDDNFEMIPGWMVGGCIEHLSWVRRVWLEDYSWKERYQSLCEKYSLLNEYKQFTNKLEDTNIENKLIGLHKFYDVANKLMFQFDSHNFFAKVGNVALSLLEFPVAFSSVSTELLEYYKLSKDFLPYYFECAALSLYDEKFDLFIGNKEEQDVINGSLGDNPNVEKKN